MANKELSRVPKRWPTAAEWERFRPNIVKLYMSEKRTLSHVKEVMWAEHGFFAT